MSQNKISVGILGGGQLSRMLAEAAKKLGLRTVAFCFSNEDPAAEVCDKIVVGSLDDEEVLRCFFGQVELVTYENDFLPYEVLNKFEQVSFIPPLEALETVRDKISQKKILESLQIHSPRFKVYNVTQSLETWIKEMIFSFEGNCVFKWARGGYDGKGVFIYQGDEGAVLKFCEEALAKSIQIFVEEKIKFKRELSQVSVQSLTEKFVFYPLVVSEQRSGICKRITGPATSLGVSSELELKAQKVAEAIGRKLNLFGCFAVEFFETENGDLLVNELAPRVHNSGHISMDAAECSQFENHWRALINKPLGSTKSAPAFAMLNLLGPDKGSVKPQMQMPPQYFFHWYGKKESRPGRKMGHINWVGENILDLKGACNELANLEKSWWVG